MNNSVRLIAFVSALFLVWGRPTPLLAEATLPCSVLGVTKPKLCVTLSVQNGFLHVLAVELKRPPTFPWGQFQSKADVESQLKSFVQAILSKQHLYEMDLPMPGSTPPTQPAVPVPDQAKTLRADTLCHGISQLKTLWPQGHELDLFISNALPKRLGELGLTQDTPLSTPSTKGSCNDASGTALLSFDVDPPIKDPGSSEQVEVDFDLGAKAFDSNGRLQTQGDIRAWLTAKYAGRFWIASAVKRHIEQYYRAAGFNPTVICALSTQTKKFVIINESTRIGRIRIPSDPSGQPDSVVDKLVYLLVTSPQWDFFHRHDAKQLLLKAGDGTFALCLPQLDGNQCSQTNDLPTGDVEQRNLLYLNTFWLSDRTAALQAIGYSLSTQSETLPDQPTNRIPAIDLVIQKIAAANATPSPTPTPTPQPNPSPSPEPSSTADIAAPAGAPAVRVKALKPGKNGRLVPADMSQPAGFSNRVAPANAPPPPPQVGNKFEYAVGVQYRPDQGARFLGNLQSTGKAIGPSLLSASGQVGTDGAHTVGNGNLDIDWLWFEKLRRRVSVQATGSTDATARRILGGAHADERRTGGSAHAEMEVFRDWHKFKWTIFAEPRRESVSLTSAGSGIGTIDLTTVTAGGPLLFQVWDTAHPMNVLFDPEVRVGTSGTAYAVTTLTARVHRRLSNMQLVSVDFSAHFQMATNATPIVDLPSLGGSDSIRGFQADDALGRQLWSVQSELWTAVPGTANAPDQGIKGFLQKNVRLAGFFDVGGISDTTLTPTPGLATGLTASAEGTRKGPGLGIRFIQGLVALKFDWAYGFGQGAFGPGHGRFYIGVSTNGAF